MARKQIGDSKTVAVWQKTNGRCWYCGVEFTADDPHDGRTGGRFTIDHVQPMGRGGTNDLANLLPACGSCNTAKGNWELEEFRIHRAHGKLKLTGGQFMYLRNLGIDLNPYVDKAIAFKFWGEEQGL